MLLPLFPWVLCSAIQVVVHAPVLWVLGLDTRRVVFTGFPAPYYLAVCNKRVRTGQYGWRLQEQRAAYDLHSDDTAPTNPDAAPQHGRKYVTDTGRTM